MVRYTCCVNGCKSISTKGSDINFIKFPENFELQSQWKGVIGRGSDFSITDKTRICSKHFRTGKPSLNPNSEDYIPSVFKTEESPPVKKSYCKSCRKITLNCPCKMMGENNEESEEEDEEVGLRLVDEGGEGEENDEEGQPEDEEGEEDEDEEDEEPAEEDEPDAGQIVDSDDDDEWTPVEEEKPKQARRSGRGSKRRQSSSDDDEEELSDAPPPAKTAKTKAVKTPTTTPRQKKQQLVGGAEAVEKTPAKNGSPEKINNNSTPASARKRGPNKSFVPAVPPVPSIQETKLLEKIKEMEEEHSRKIEMLQRNYNMRIANLQEEHTQKIHKMKIEWEVERSNLQTQIDFFKESVHNGMTEELPINTDSFREDQPIIIVRTEHLQDPSFRDE